MADNLVVQAHFISPGAQLRREVIYVLKLRLLRPNVAEAIRNLKMAAHPWRNPFLHYRLRQPDEKP
jgi:hypothetical protein